MEIEKRNKILMWIYIITISLSFIVVLILYIQKSVGADTCECQVCEPQIEMA